MSTQHKTSSVGFGLVGTAQLEHCDMLLCRLCWLLISGVASCSPPFANVGDACTSDADCITNVCDSRQPRTCRSTCDFGTRIHSCDDGQICYANAAGANSTQACRYCGLDQQDHRRPATANYYVPATPCTTQADCPVNSYCPHPSPTYLKNCIATCE
jgi:hypothetical protein